MRFFLFSLVLHIAMIVFALETMKTKLEFKHVGNPKISCTMIGASEKISGSSQDLVFKKQVQQSEKKMTKKEKKKVKPKKKKIVKKNVTKKKQKTKKEIIKNDKKIIKKIEKIQKKEVNSELDTTLKENDEVPLESIVEIKTQEGKNTTDQNSQEEDIKTGFVKLADGSIAAKNQGVKGLSYGFLYQPEPNYPKIAKKIGFDKDIIIKVRFLIGYDGHVEEIKFYDNVEEFGFRNEVNKALNQWRSTPITVNGNKVKLYFYKKFKFEKII